MGCALPSASVTKMKVFGELTPVFPSTETQASSHVVECCLNVLSPNSVLSELNPSRKRFRALTSDLAWVLHSLQHSRTESCFFARAKRPTKLPLCQSSRLQGLATLLARLARYPLKAFLLSERSWDSPFRASAQWTSCRKVSFSPYALELRS